MKSVGLRGGGRLILPPSGSASGHCCRQEDGVHPISTPSIHAPPQSSYRGMEIERCKPQQIVLAELG